MIFGNTSPTGRSLHFEPKWQQFRFGPRATARIRPEDMILDTDLSRLEEREQALFESELVENDLG